MNIKIIKGSNLKFLYNRFEEILLNENSCNEGEFTERDLLVIYKLIDFYNVHASPKEKRDILSLLNGEW